MEKKNWLNDYKEYKEPLHRMATKALHLTGDISRDEPDLCTIWGEDGNDYVGHWDTGLGFIEVKFPKETTRRLTESEVEFWCKMVLVMNGMTMQKYTKEMFDK